MKDRKGVRQKLILTMIEEIERTGLTKVTVRNVAKVAEVNVAAINYYFGSKANLIEAALKETMDHLIQDLTDYLEALRETPRTTFQEMLTYIFEGSLRYPKMTRSHIHDVFIDGQEQGILSERLAPIVEASADVLVQACAISHEQAMRRAVQAFSAVLFPSFFQNFFFFSDVHTNVEARQMYILDIVENTFKQCSS